MAMPSRKMSDHCDKCGGKNHSGGEVLQRLRSALPDNRAKKDLKGRVKLHADIAHPINLQCRSASRRSWSSPSRRNWRDQNSRAIKPMEMDEPDDEVPDVTRDCRTVAGDRLAPSTGSPRLLPRGGLHQVWRGHVIRSSRTLSRTSSSRSVRSYLPSVICRRRRSTFC